MELSMKQINDLITGVHLSAEIAASSPGLRHFVTVAGYAEKDGRKKQLDKYISAEKRETTVFLIRDYEVPKEYIENDWEIPDRDIKNEVYIEGIVGIENIQKELTERISDLSLLVPHWECAAPI